MLSEAIPAGEAAHDLAVSLFGTLYAAVRGRWRSSAAPPPLPPFRPPCVLGVALPCVCFGDKRLSALGVLLPKLLVRFDTDKEK